MREVLQEHFITCTEMKEIFHLKEFELKQVFQIFHKEQSEELSTEMAFSTFKVE